MGQFIKITPFGRTLVDNANAADARVDLGLGSAATQDSSAFDPSGSAAAALATALAASQPLDSDLTAIAALSTTAFGRALLTLLDAAAGRTALGLGTLATQNGTFSGTSSGTNTGDQDLSGYASLAANVTWTGFHTWQVSASSAIAIGPNGDTNPTLRIVTNVANAVTGLSVTGNAAGSGVTVTVLSDGTNENINIIPKGTGSVIVGTDGVNNNIRLLTDRSGLGWYHYLGSGGDGKFIIGSTANRDISIIPEGNGGFSVPCPGNGLISISNQHASLSLLQEAGPEVALITGTFNSTAARTMLGIRRPQSITGPLIQLQDRSSTTNDRKTAEIDTAWIDSTDATRKAQAIRRVYDTVARETDRGWADGSAGRFACAAPASQPNDAHLAASQISFYLDEGGNKLHVRVCYADGTTFKTGEIALT